MAWHIDEHVVRGEIDNRVRGAVTGRIWFAGRAEPVELALAGNAAPDLAGRRLAFVNPSPQTGLPEAFATRQEGCIGDITASRKVRVPDPPLDERKANHEPGMPPSWRWGNALHLEWFSRSNGRVVIETVAFELRIVGEPAWEMTAEDEAQRQHDCAAAMTGILGPMTATEEDEPSPGFTDDEGGDQEETPPTEEEAEEAQARTDLLVDRIQARLDQEGEHADYSQILHEEIERLRRERGEPDLLSELSEEGMTWIESADDAPYDPDLIAASRIEHPLATKAFDLSVQLMADAEENGWIPPEAGEEHPAADLVGAAMKAGAKMAGALNGTAWPPQPVFCAGVIVRLRRARVYLDDALRASEACHEQKLIAPVLLGPILVELIDLARETDELIAELRARLGRGKA